ncbi:MAG: hypothetical protein ACOY94_15665 [Bacillota bacterium]
MINDSSAPGKGGREVQVTHFVDLTQLLAEQPDIRRLAVMARGSAIEWPAKFRRAMREVCKDRALTTPIPPRLMAAVIPARGILLLWPGIGDDERGFEVQASPAGRRVTTDLKEAFDALSIHLPYGVVVAVPATRYLHPVHGECLALHFRSAEFLPEKSRTAAGLMEE